MGEELIVLMSTVHQHLLMENRLERQGIDFKTVVKPRQLGTDCGMALSVKIDDVPQIQAIAARERAVVYGIFIRDGDTWMEWHGNKY